MVAGVRAAHRPAEIAMHIENQAQTGATGNFRSGVGLVVLVVCRSLRCLLNTVAWAVATDGTATSPGETAKG